MNVAAWGNRNFEPRQGCMLHFDASASDQGAMAWMLNDPRCKVSYHWLVLDNGAQLTVAPPNARAWHAGVCRPSNPKLTYRDANSAFYGIAIAAKDGERATKAQEVAVLRLCHALFAHHHWSFQDDLWRVVGHDTEAWPRGRKHDPTGSDPSKPVLSVAEIRELLKD